MKETKDFHFWGDYASAYAAQAVKEGFAQVEKTITEQRKTVGWTNTGPTTTTVEICHVIVTKPGFKRPGPCGDTEAVVGATGTYRLK